MKKTNRVLRLVAIALPLSFALGACETLENLNPFDERKTPLAGERRPVFTQGVPGVEYNAPPTQPSNSNVAIPPPATTNPDGTPDLSTPNAAAPNAPQNPSEDPWAGRRR